MAEWHLRELRGALEQKGWQIIAELPGQDNATSCVWEIRRSTREPAVFIAFEGQDELTTLPIAESYGCHISPKALSFCFPAHVSFK